MTVSYNRDETGDLFPTCAAPGSLEHQLISLVHGTYISLTRSHCSDAALLEPVSVDDMENHTACFSTLTVHDGDTKLTIYKVLDVYLLEAFFSGMTVEEPGYPAEPANITERKLVTDGRPAVDIKLNQRKEGMSEEDAWLAVFSFV